VHRLPIPVTRAVPHGATNTYLVGRDRALLVDPAARHPDLDALVDERTVTHLAVTHTHPDHVGGVARYADRTGATVWAKRGTETAFEAATGVEPDRTFGDGDGIDTDAGRVRVVDAPGHARDHVAFETEGGTVVCGDVAVAEGSVVVAAPEGDMRAYLTALRRLRARDPGRLCPGHGPPIDDPREALDRLVHHRLDRERRVRSAVAGGARTLDEIVDAAYDKDLRGVREMARATVRAHLEKLAVEGDLSWDGATAFSSRRDE
jgi:glyoxylase-like metal-dependent hydrolase (beta-lactamase superfamily II)